MIDLAKLNEIAQRILKGEFSFYMSAYATTDGLRCAVTLTKGSAYGKFNLRVEGHGETPSEAFEAALRQFPPNPIDGIAQWDSQRLSPPAVDGEFKEVE